MALLKSFMQDSGVNVGYWYIQSIKFDRGAGVEVELLGYLSEYAKKEDGCNYHHKQTVTLPWSIVVDYKDSSLKDLYTVIYNEVKNINEWTDSTDAID